jgi:hypothetical protein
MSRPIKGRHDSSPDAFHLDRSGNLASLVDRPEAAIGLRGALIELSDENARLNAELMRLRRHMELCHSADSIAELEARLTGVLSSTSWKITAPIRRLMERLRGA